MQVRYTLAVGSLFIILVGYCLAQERFESGWLKGFAKSPIEHIIDKLDRPFTANGVKGVVLDPSGAKMDGAIVEVRNEAGQVRGIKTNRRGAFKLGGVPKGTYKFKVTMNGFQSVVGDIVVMNNTKNLGQIRIVMKPGE